MGILPSSSDGQLLYTYVGLILQLSPEVLIQICSVCVRPVKQMPEEPKRFFNSKQQHYPPQPQNERHPSSPNGFIPKPSSKYEGDFMTLSRSGIITGRQLIGPCRQGFEIKYLLSLWESFFQMELLTFPALQLGGFWPRSFANFREGR